jgi:hypothetical protein
MATREDRLIGLQRAEFSKAQRLGLLVLLTPTGTAALAGAAVFITTPILSYSAAVLAFVLVVVWAFLDWRFRECRSQAERARRATLLMEGLGEQVSKAEVKDLEAAFTVTEEEGAKYIDPNYYSAQAQAGHERLAEMLEESTFWSYHLMRTSAQFAWIMFGGALLFGIILFFAAIPFFQASQLQGAVRVFCALLALLVSTEVFGRALSYSGASMRLGTIRPRLDAVRASGFPRADLLILLCDYNSAVEAAPMVLPGVYKLKRKTLNRIWKGSAT